MAHGDETGVSYTLWYVFAELRLHHPCNDEQFAAAPAGRPVTFRIAFLCHFFKARSRMRAAATDLLL